MLTHLHNPPMDRFLNESITLEGVSRFNLQIRVLVFPVFPPPPQWHRAWMRAAPGELHRDSSRKSNPCMISCTKK